MEVYRVSKNCENTLEHNFEEYLKEIHSAEKEVKIVSGRLNPFVYERKEFLQEIEWLLYKKRLSLAFYKPSKDFFFEENKGLIEVLQKFKDNFTLNMLPIIPTSQYLVTDNSVLVQEEHKPLFKRDLYVFRDDKETALKWANNFKELIEVAGDSTSIKLI